jgi:hypothetical protein
MEQLFPNPRVRKNRGKKDCRPKNPPQRLRLETLEERTLLSSDPIAGAGFSPPPPALVETVEPLQPLSITGSTMDKPQSKLWFHDNNW